MRHLTITEYGQFVGVTSERVVVRDSDKTILETPLSRLRSISIAKDGVSFSSNLVLACAQRGVRLFITDWRGIAVAAIAGQHRHAIASLRKKQFEFIDGANSKTTAAGMIYGKLRNQRAVLLYFSKYHKQHTEKIYQTAEFIQQQAQRLRRTDWAQRKRWREEIVGLEGAAAAAYWQTIAELNLLGNGFEKRIGRGAPDLPNQMLNYGYSLLTSYVWSALDNAGFELYAGILHVERAGKPSLVLDMMEEYRAWVVDRQVIKLRSQIKNNSILTIKLKKQLSKAIQETMSSKHLYQKKRLRLETILQRQAYRLAACMVDEKRYQPMRFKW